jgi:hypothetical protein
MKYLLIFTFAALAVIYACNDSGINPFEKKDPPPNYNKVLTAEQGSTRFDFYSATGTTLMSGYNDVGFKVFIGGEEMETGFVKFYPKMIHPFLPNYWHSTPVSNQFNYDASKNLFTGYASFFMVSDSNSNWFGFYNYNNTNHADSIMFNVIVNPDSQVRMFLDEQAQCSYYITVAVPMYPSIGPNDLKLLLHRSNDEVDFTQIDSAQMYIRTWMQSMGHGSSGNANPVYIGDGYYQGTINLTMSGTWTVYDSIYYQNRFITPNPTPKLYFNCP